MTSEIDRNTKGKAKNASTRGKAQRFNDATFIQYELDKNAAAACKAWQVDGSALLHSVQSLCDSGYKFSLKFDDFSDCYASFMSQSDDKGANAGFILTGRGSTPEKALKQLLYKHFEVMAERWEEFAPIKRSLDLDD